MNFFHLKRAVFGKVGIPHAKERFTGSCVTNRYAKYNQPYEI